MKNYLDRLPNQLRNIVRLAGCVAGESKAHIYLVGGIVRDLILGVANFDLDITVEGDGLMFASLLANRLKARLITHPRFKTATLIISDISKMDVATTRSEVYPKPASLPVVYPGTIRDDLARRDFTINTLAIDLTPKYFGNLVDFYQGKYDLEKGLIRILHNLSFIDDPTRIIRAVRFEQRFKFKIEPLTLKLLKEAAVMLKHLSPHRLRDEFILILKEQAALRCILRLKNLVGLDFIHRQVKLNKAKLAHLKAIKNEIEWFNNNFPKYRFLDTWLMYFMVILDGLTNKQIRQTCERFGLRRGELKRIDSYNRLSSRVAKGLSKKNLLPSQVYRELGPLSLEVILGIKAKYKSRLLGLYIKRFFKYYNGMSLFIRGKDLNNLGLKPGPRYKKILSDLLDLQLDGKINSRNEALNWIAVKRAIK